MQLFDIKSAFPDEIYNFITGIGESRFRADQMKFSEKWAEKQIRQKSEHL